MTNSEVLIKVENVSKKFCRRLKRSLWYGMKDLGAELIGRSNSHKDLRKDEFWAVRDVSFELKRGECLGLIGPNGSGKSTLLKMLNGLIKPDKGKITMRGRVGALIELGAGFNPILTGRENIYINGSVLGFTNEQISDKFESIIEFADIGEFIDTPVQNYSSGMRVRLGFAVAAHMEPDVLIIDEVLAVGDMGFIIKCINRMQKLIQNTSVIFVSHAMPMVSLVCTKVMVLDSGKVGDYNNDVNSGIDYYLSKFDSSKGSVSGNGKAVISDVVLSNGHQCASGNDKLPLDYGDDLSIEMKLTLSSSVEQVGIKVLFLSIQMLSVADCLSEFCGFEINPEKHSKIKLKISNMQLNMGIYSICVVVTDLSNNEILTRNDSVAYIQAMTKYTSWAPIILSGKWSMD